MKKIKNKRLVLMLVILPLSMLVHSIQADADAVSIMDSPNATIVDGEGLPIGGNTNVDMRNVIPLSYTTGDITTSLNGSAEEPLSKNKRYPAGTEFRIPNVGYYNGSSIEFVFKVNKSGYLLWDYGWCFIPSGNTQSYNPSYDIRIEDDQGNEINDPNVKFLLPLWVEAKQTDGLLIQEFSSINGQTGHLFVRKIDNKDGLQSQYVKDFRIDNTNSYIRLIYTSSYNVFNYVFASGGHLILNSTYTGGLTYPELTLPSRDVTNSSISFFSPTAGAVIPLYNSAPAIDNTVNDESLKANVSIKQALYKQAADSLYSENFEIIATVPDILKTTGNLGNLKVVDNTGNDITSQVTLSNVDAKTVKVVIPQSVLKTLGNNLITIKGAFDIDLTNEALMDYYNMDTGYFSFTTTAKNSDSDVTNSGIAKVKAPLPTGDPVAQTVSKGTSSDDLLPRDLVKNLNSLIPNDVVSVVGFKEKKTFTATSDTIVVQIKSEKTGTIADITVPITAVSEPVVTDQAKLSWSNTGVTTNKTTELSSSDLSEPLTEEFYWQTTFPNKNYQLIVKKGDTILTQKLADNTSTGNNSWLKEAMAIPLDQLSTGVNELTIGIYALNAANELKGGALSTINLTVTITDDNAELSWNNTDPTQKTKTEDFDKSTMADSLEEKIYWQTDSENKSYMLVTKDAADTVITSQMISNESIVNQFQEATIALPTNKLNYGDNKYTVGVYTKDSATETAIGEPLDEITLTITVTGTLQLLSIPESIDFNLQKINPRETIRVDAPKVSGDLVIADTRNKTQNNWVVKVTLTKPLESKSPSGKQVILPNAIKYKAPDKEEFTVTSDAQEIESKTDGYGKFNISSEWGNTKESAGFKFETPPANIGTLGAYTGEITYTISDTYEP